MSIEDRITALAALRAEVAAGRVAAHSPDYYRIREAAKMLDPAFRARKAAYQRARKAELAGNPALMAAYRAGQEVARQRRPDRYDAAPAPKPRVKYRCKQTDPGIVKLQAADRARIDAVAAQIQAETAPCAAYVLERGWRVRCWLGAGHDGRCAFRRTA